MMNDARRQGQVADELTFETGITTRQGKSVVCLFTKSQGIVNKKLTACCRVRGVYTLRAGKVPVDLMQGQKSKNSSGSNFEPEDAGAGATPICVALYPSKNVCDH